MYMDLGGLSKQERDTDLTFEPNPICFALLLFFFSSSARQDVAASIVYIVNK